MWGALHFAAYRGGESSRVTCEMLLEAGAPASARTDQGRTPLHLAGMSGYTGSVYVLLENGARGDSLDNDKQTPLHQGVKKFVRNHSDASFLVQVL